MKAPNLLQQIWAEPSAAVVWGLGFVGVVVCAPYMLGRMALDKLRGRL